MRGSMMVAIIILAFVLAICGYGNMVMRGAAWGVGRESAHMVFRR